MATIQQNLDEARNAYHSLQTGTMARVVVDLDGSRVEFTAAKKSDLYAYIQQLEAQVAPASVVRPTNGPVGFLF